MLRLIAAALVISAAVDAAPREAAASSLEELKSRARARVASPPRVALADTVTDGDAIEQGRVPNYVRAVQGIAGAPKLMAQLIKTAIYDGAVEPEVKLAMGLRIAQIHSSPYAAVHLDRLLAAAERNAKPEARSLAVRYAELLTRDVHGVSDADFAALRGAYNDGQIVELTMTTCLFNYFTRMVEALNLPVEQWAFEPARPSVKVGYSKPAARVAIVSDEQANAVTAALAAIKDNQANPAGLGLGFANSQRAFLLSPAFGAAWRAYGSAVRASSAVDRELKLHVSFAVSMANGCRYCTLHQVQGLRRVGVSPSKLMAMKKDNSALSPRELTAVRYARKLTAEPASITDADWAELQKQFGEQGALEVTLQTSAFAFMNRFTDGLRLPSEDEAVKTYLETYGSAYEEPAKR